MIFKTILAGIHHVNYMQQTHIKSLALLTTRAEMPREASGLVCIRKGLETKVLALADHDVELHSKFTWAITELRFEKMGKVGNVFKSGCITDVGYGHCCTC